ncbi:MAG: hypothetical protein LRY27_02965 [Chitinophagales bacterium]|nr:hypothetical protein [Chitinophagales bacterium]
MFIDKLAGGFEMMECGNDGILNDIVLLISFYFCIMGGPIGFAEYARRIIKENRELKNSISAKYKDIKAGKHQDGNKPLRFKKSRCCHLKGYTL